ncbi:MAG: DUF971 domain-containing protein [Dehalococcoidia bacterium]|nr:DUF971 domain-containing protein [Dehalococcoidia bacterium]
MTRPNKVEVHKDKILMQWDDGHGGVHLSKGLREACPCANCVDEWTGERKIVPGSISDNIHIMEANPVGNYAVSIAFSDGHNTGIYRFGILRALCSCEECIAAKAGQTAP